MSRVTKLQQAIKTEAPALAAPLVFACPECGKRLKVKPALAGKKVKCPKCSLPVLVPTPESEPEPEVLEVMPQPTTKRFSILALILVTLVIFGCSIYANLSFTVTNRVNFKYFPPFKAYDNRNDNGHLGAEYYSIAKALVAGEGFASPFNDKTGPTAWMPPILPARTAGLIWICDGDKAIVMTIVIFLQVYTLIFTGLVVLLLVRQTTMRLWALVAAAIFLVAVIGDFHIWFQFTHDCWFILLMVDLLVAGGCWFRPLDTWKRAAFWGLFGGICAMSSPIAGLAWAVLTVATMLYQRAWLPFGIAVALSILTLSPWVVRNYLIFGKLIPVKSNLAYELWQSQCHRAVPDGILKPDAFGSHPYVSANRERQMYREMGEIPFLDKKKQLFMQAVSADPLDYADRVAARFFAATLWYIPFNRAEVVQRPWTTWMTRVLHPLPFLALVALCFSAFLRRLHWSQWLVCLLYVSYLLPYVAVSYYDRYAVPLLAVKVLLVIWAFDRLLSVRQLLRPEEEVP